MATSIDAELRRKCAENREIGLLLAQWEYDQRLLEQALGAVGHLFPHYSQHDASHSRTILERIAALLGEESLLKLSGADLWFLLEAAYFHDAGMVASYARKSDDVKSEDFARHVERCARAENSDLARAAERLRTKVPRSAPGEILEGNFDLLLVYAEFVRARHPQRAAEFAIDPLRHLAIASPRTPLLPGRFWHLLGQICRAHGEDREFVMSLPREESGMGGELLHPRFVACMLRLGDLLDLDSGRFCPAINAMVPRLPESSEAHSRKHEGVRHLLVSPQRVSVVATYTDVDAYLEAERWFSWLRDELRDQLVSWDQIAPSPDFAPLPSLGDVQARLEGQVVLAPTSRPRFDVDRDKVLDLVRGANLYEGPQDAVREVLQNAIDATLFRYAYDCRCAGRSAPESLEALREDLRRMPIRVAVEKAPTQPSDPDVTRWLVQVHDQGIGLRVADVGHLLRLGSSGRNHDRRELASWLPEWARPSGTFGIGFHSLFEYCRKVDLTTRHPTDAEGLGVTFEVRHEGKEPTVVVRKREQTDYPPPPGTRIEAEFEFDRIPTRVSWGSRSQREADRVVNEYDFVNDGDLPYHPAKIRDTIGDLARMSLCPVELTGPSSHAVVPSTAIGEGASFVQDAGVELRLRSVSLALFPVDTRFRGAEVDNKRRWPLLGLDCNLHAGDARDLLELSRKELTRRGNEILEERIDLALKTCVPMWLKNFRSADGDKDYLPVLSLYAALFGHEQIAGLEWRSLELECKDQAITLGDIADAQTLDLHFSPGSARTASRPPLRVARAGNGIELVDVNSDRTGSGWLSDFVRAHFAGRTFVGGSASTGGRHYRLEKGAQLEEVTDLGLRYELLDDRIRGIGCRGTLMCPARFASLAIPDRASGWWNRPDAFVDRQMANPFVLKERDVTVPRPEAYVRWLAAHREEPESAVAARLIQFLTHADSIAAGDWGARKRYDLASVVAALRSAFGLEESTEPLRGA